MFKRVIILCFRKYLIGTILNIKDKILYYVLLYQLNLIIMAQILVFLEHVKRKIDKPIIVLELFECNNMYQVRILKLKTFLLQNEINDAFRL